MLKNYVFLSRSRKPCLSEMTDVSPPLRRLCGAGGPAGRLCGCRWLVGAFAHTCSFQQSSQHCFNLGFERAGGLVLIPLKDFL